MENLEKEVVDSDQDQDQEVEIFLKKDGTPFPDSRSAKMVAGQMERSGKIVRVIELPEGGYGIKQVKNGKNREPLKRHNKLNAKYKDPNYEYRVVNDAGDRIYDFNNAGWEFDRDNPLSDRMAGEATVIGGVPSKDVGKGTRAVLMRKKKQWFEEDYAIKQKEIDERVARMKRVVKHNSDGLNHPGNDMDSFDSVFRGTPR